MEVVALVFFMIDSRLKTPHEITDQLLRLLESDPISGDIDVCLDDAGGMVRIIPGWIKFHLTGNQLSWSFKPDFESQLTLQNDDVEMRVDEVVLNNNQSITLKAGKRYDISIKNKGWLDLKEPVNVKFEEF